MSQKTSVLFNKVQKKCIFVTKKSQKMHLTRMKIKKTYYSNAINRLHIYLFMYVHP